MREGRKQEMGNGWEVGNLRLHQHSPNMCSAGDRVHTPVATIVAVSTE